ncbi:MAG: CHAT domain-containing protein [Blastocatellia bacterium]|nr:CHAT domain-containing protein [Blastocatellia bacterium]
MTKKRRTRRRKRSRRRTKEPKDEPEEIQPAVDQVQRFAYSTTRCRALAAAMLQAGRIDAAIRLIELLKEQESLEWAGQYSDGTMAGASAADSELNVLADLERELVFWRLSDVRRASMVESLEPDQKKSKKSKKPKSEDEEVIEDEAATEDEEKSDDEAVSGDEKKSKDEKKAKDDEKSKDKGKKKDKAKDGSLSWVSELEGLGDRILVREQEASILRVTPPANRSTLQSERLATLEAELAALANDVDVLMARVASNSTSKDPRVKRLRASDGLPLTLSRLGPGVAALYTLVADERCWIVLITPNGKTAFSTSIQAAKLNALAMSFRETLTNPKLDPLPLAGQLYDILIKPVAAELAATRTTTLLWSFDGVMRYVPVAALHDGQGYLVEKYQNVLFTRESLERLLEEPAANTTGVGFGVASKVGNFNALPAVADELRGIFTDDRAVAEGGVINGRVSIDASFTEAAFEQALQEGYGIIHVATHFQLEPTKAEDSVLLLGDGTLMNVGDIRDIKRAFKGTDLLTLSACNTASSSTRGDGKEVESFATIAQDRGAKAVLASLWSVNDRSTSAMMQTFYRLRVSRGVSKAEALRKSQEMLLRGSLVMPSGPDPDRMLVHEEPKPTSIHGKFTPDPRAPFAHPYYWAPFTLVGNYK